MKPTGNPMSRKTRVQVRQQRNGHLLLVVDGKPALWPVHVRPAYADLDTPGAAIARALREMA